MAVKAAKIYIFILIFLHAGINRCPAQFIDTTYFRSPLNIPLYLSATFGELRPDHFHSGIDIKTQGKTGLPIYAPADGYIARVKIMLAGYGKSLYIIHPNNTTTVYGHLLRFTPAVEKFIRTVQYSRQEFAVDTEPESGRFPVKKGELIGYTGNSGYSFGPHLHFEVRKTHPENVLSYGFGITDNIKPEILSLIIYPQSLNSVINGKNIKQIIPVIKKSDGRYTLHPDSNIHLMGPVGFGIETYDLLDGSNNKCGIYSQQLIIDTQIICSVTFNQVSFDETRFVNTYMDYAEKLQSKREIHTSFAAPFNELSIYSILKHKGIFTGKNKNYTGQYIIRDVHGNTSTLSFTFRADSILPQLLSRYQPQTFSALMNYDRENRFDTTGIKITIPALAIYNNLLFEYKCTDTIPAGYFTPIHTLHNEFTPVHKNITVSLQPNGLPDSLVNKAVIAMFTSDNKRSCPGGIYKNGWITTQVRSFGRFTVGIDTTAPELKLLNGKPGGDYTKERSIRFSMKDDFSGVLSFNGYIDGKWALFEYDVKSNTIEYFFDTTRITQAENHYLEMVIVDNRQNITMFNMEFRY